MPRKIDLETLCRPQLACSAPASRSQLCGSRAYLLTFDFLGCKHLIDAHIEGLTPQLAVSPLGAWRGGISGPGSGGQDVRTALAAEANGTLNNKKNKLLQAQQQDWVDHLSSFLSLTEHKSDICKKERTMPQGLLGRRALSWAWARDCFHTGAGSIRDLDKAQEHAQRQLSDMRWALLFSIKHVHSPEEWWLTVVDVL